MVLVDERKERIKTFFNANGEGSTMGIFDYFRETKWIFAISKRLYERYLTELRWFLQTSKGVGFVLDLGERHGEDGKMLALRDQDVVQILLDTAYLRVKIDSSEIERIRCLAESESDAALISNLGNLTKSRN